MLAIVLCSAVVLLIAYRTYGSVLARLVKLDGDKPTPAVEQRDDIDFAPTAPSTLLSQHFSAIAAAGPIVGPVLAGAMFGWLPALLWILVGAIFIGGVHDFIALVASVRHRATSVAEVVKQHIGVRSWMLFMVFVWVALLYIIVAFTDITAASFVGMQTLENGQVVSGAGIATSSTLYLVLSLTMGLLVRSGKVSMGVATPIFLVLVIATIAGGQYIPLDLASVAKYWQPGLSDDAATHMAHQSWNVLLLVYCWVASLLPMWLLLQPRGQLGGFLLYGALAAGGVGVLLGGSEIAFPAFVQWETPAGEALFPMLFITIACGACSGFHSLIASGTTSKQLRKETDARPIGYGAMLLEAMVAIISLCCLMRLAPGSSLAQNPQPNLIYAQGIGGFLAQLGIPPAVGVTFALMAFTTFIYDTLDVCTRLGRYIIEELTGLRGTAGKLIGSVLTAAVPVAMLLQAGAAGGAPAWKTFWSLFGASNQLLAALVLLGATIWLWNTRRAWWPWLVVGVPMLWMYIISVWALSDIVRAHLRAGPWWRPVPCIAMLLLVLAGLMMIEAIRAVLRGRVELGPPHSTEPVPATL